MTVVWNKIDTRDAAPTTTYMKHPAANLVLFWCQQWQSPGGFTDFYWQLHTDSQRCPSHQQFSEAAALLVLAALCQTASTGWKVLPVLLPQSCSLGQPAMQLDTEISMWATKLLLSRHLNDSWKVGPLFCWQGRQRDHFQDTPQYCRGCFRNGELQPSKQKCV